MNKSFFSSMAIYIPVQKEIVPHYRLQTHQTLSNNNMLLLILKLKKQLSLKYLFSQFYFIFRNIKKYLPIFFFILYLNRYIISIIINNPTKVGHFKT